DRMASGAAGFEKIRAFVRVNYAGFGVTRPGRVMLPGGQPVTHHDRDILWIIQRAVLHPLTRRFVAEREGGAVPGQSILARTRSLAKLLAYQLDILFFAGKEKPAWLHVKLVRISFQFLRRVSFGIDADGVKEDVLAHPLAEQPLHLSQFCGLEWTSVATFRVDEIDYDRLAPKKIVVEVNCFPVLRNQRHIGKIVPAPGGAVVCGGGWAQG